MVDRQHTREGKTPSIWSIRGVSQDLQARISAAAKGRRMTLGEWISAAAEAALARGMDRQQVQDPEDRLGNLEARVAELEARLGEVDARLDNVATSPTAMPVTRPAPSQGSGRGAGGGAKRLTPEQDRMIADMLGQNRSYSEIGAAVGISPGAITKIRERLAREGLLSKL
jgi:hypothetical protein